MANAAQHIDLKIINDEELLKLFHELNTKLQNKIVLGGMRTAAAIINQQAKSNFRAIAKGQSRTKYKGLNSFFKVEPIRKYFGVKVGVTSAGYKYRWLNWGTDERSYIKGQSRANQRYFKSSGKSGGKEHKTGSLPATNFFFDAVEQRKEEAQSKVSQAIIDSMNRTVNKYNKK